MDNARVQQVVEQSVLTLAKAVEDKLDEEISALGRLDVDDLEALRERRMQQLKKAAERRSRWASLGHGEYSEIPEKEFFSSVKASDLVVCHFYRENWPCKLSKQLLKRESVLGTIEHPTACLCLKRLKCLKRLTSPLLPRGTAICPLQYSCMELAENDQHKQNRVEVLPSEISVVSALFERLKFG